MRGPFLAFLSTLLLGCNDNPSNNDNDHLCPSSPIETSSARIFAIQPRIALGQFDTYATYQEHLVELARNTVANCLAQDRPNIIVFPENTGLSAAFIGSRGQAARESTSAFAALLALGGQYAQPINFYKNKWPNVPLPNHIELGITDTVWRAFFETNQLIATELGAWVVASANMSGQVELLAQYRKTEEKRLVCPRICPWT